MPYNLLSEPIRKYIRDKRWDALRPIQAAAIVKITTTNLNYILASRTASGKTEAAFLPILSKTDFNQVGVQVLYISPLIALINDQFYRITDLCENLEIKVTKWHGEANKSLKSKLIKNPSGIVMITPESLEAMFVNAPYNAHTLFGNLKYIIIDEIHSFIGVDRGIQLMSILSRIQRINKENIITIGLSATIGTENYLEAKKLIGNISETKILLDKEKKETVVNFKYFSVSTKELSLDLIKDLYAETCNHKVLIFPNSRGKAEEIAVKLKKISEKLHGHRFYYSHHSSVDKEIREDIEKFAKNNERYNFCISCTSTLELGIDIGTIDKIVQIDSTHSVSSLVQRIGRSGRREGEKSIINIYATDKWNLLQSLACWQLYNSDFLEPLHISDRPFDILFHQLLSISKQLSGISKASLTQQLKTNFAFSLISEQDIISIIDYSISKNYLELLGNEIILGVEGENIVNTKEFYSVFKTEPSFKVINSGHKIGDIPFSQQVIPDANILLAARIWKIIDIDFKSAKITVIPANDGKKPIFFGSIGETHEKVRVEMLRILKSSEEYIELDNSSKDILTEFRNDFKGFIISDFQFDRPIVVKSNKIKIYTFTGTKINNSLVFLISLTGIDVILNDQSSTLEIDINIDDIGSLTNKINDVYVDIDFHLKNSVETNESLLNFSKWGKFLPISYQCQILKERTYDFENAISFLNRLIFIESDI